MKTHKLSRRRLLSGLLATLTAWLCPRPHRADASRRPTPSIALPPSRSVHTCTYTYDSRGRLVRVTDHPPRPIEPVRRNHVTPGHGVTYLYGKDKGR
ncbi:MAG TPA: hypothetical protein VH643_16445 [Gemmataceae bacterium]|jgi:hypothetical protein